MDNEKAATFIGWREGQECQLMESQLSGGWDAEGQRVARSRDFTCECRFVHPRNTPLSHAIPAPDMSDPRNYMRALEAAAQSKGDVVLELRNGASINFSGGSLDFNYDGPCCDSIAFAAVHFLAALYDAEASK